MCIEYSKAFAGRSINKLIKSLFMIQRRCALLQPDTQTTLTPRLPVTMPPHPRVTATRHPLDGNLFPNTQTISCGWVGLCKVPEELVPIIIKHPTHQFVRLSGMAHSWLPPTVTQPLNGESIAANINIKINIINVRPGNLRDAQSIQ